MIKNFNRAVKAQRKAGIDIWEARHGSPKRRRNAKRVNKRARRRLDKVVAREAS